MDNCCQDAVFDVVAPVCGRFYHIVPSVGDSDDVWVISALQGSSYFHFARMLATDGYVKSSMLSIPVWETSACSIQFCDIDMSCFTVLDMTGSDGTISFKQSGFFMISAEPELSRPAPASADSSSN